MAVKSILAIDVDDGKFREFKELYDQYQETLEKMPAQWQDVAKGTKSAASHFEEIAAAAEAYSKAVDAVRRANEKSQAVVSSTGKIWHTMARDTRTVAGNIADITRQLLRWAEITGVVSGLLGAGGLFGISRLAQSAASGRQQASGFDVSYGQNRAFAINYGRFLDNPSGTLGNVSNALHDATSPGYRALLGAGLSPQFLQSHNAAEVSAELLHRLPGRIPHATAQDRALEGSRLRAYGLDGLISQQELNRYLNASPAERAAQDKAFAHDSKDFDQTGKTQREWQDFTTQLDRAGTKIDEIFIKGLAPLAKPLSDLSDSLAKSIGALLGSDKLKGWITDLGHGIENVSQYLLSPSFDRDMKSFVTGIEDVVKALGVAYRWINGIFNHDAAQPARGFFVGHVGKDGVIDLHNRSRHRGRHGYLGTKRGTTVPGAQQPDIPPDWNPRNSNSYWNGDEGAVIPDGWGPDLHHMAYVPGRDNGPSAGSERFGRSFMMMVLAAEAVTAKFKDLADAVGTLTSDGTGVGGLLPGAAGASTVGSAPSSGYRRSSRLRGDGSVHDYGTFHGATAGKISGGEAERAQRLMDRLVNVHGWTPAAAAIAAGNAEQESGIRSDGPMGDPSTPGGSWGMFQWNRQRLAALKAFGGANWRDFDVQTDFFAKEAERMVPGWKRQKDLSNAARIGKLYEGYGDNSTGTRVANAHRWNDRYHPGHGRGLAGYHGIVKPPRIEIQNNTGGNAVILSNMMTVGT